METSPPTVTRRARSVVLVRTNSGDEVLNVGPPVKVGAPVKVPDRAPPQCSFGGIGTHFHSHLVPTMAMISGPWTLWAPSFGAEAVDHERMRRQTLAAITALGPVPREQIAGPYLDLRRARAGGAPTCSHEMPPEWAPRR